MHFHRNRFSVNLQLYFAIMPRFLTDSLVVDKSKQASLQVLAAGLPRCATSSLQAALESPHIQLAPCMHMAHVAPNVDRGKVLLEALGELDDSRRHKLLHILFDGYQASTDYPGSLFADDLMDMYPEAKIILNKRPGGGAGWPQSMNNLAWAKYPKYYATCFLWSTDRNLYHIWHACSKRSMRLLGLTADELNTEKHYEAHNAWVHAEAAKRGREVFEFEPKDGWKALCQLLGKDAPDSEPFPHVNDAAQVQMIKRILYARGAISWALLIGVVVGSVKKGFTGRFF